MEVFKFMLFKRIFGDTRCGFRLLPIVTRAWSTNASTESDVTDKPTFFHYGEQEHRKIVRSAVIGAPNAGKSTLTNALIGQKVRVWVYATSMVTDRVTSVTVRVTHKWCRCFRFPPKSTRRGKKHLECLVLTRHKW